MNNLKLLLIGLIVLIGLWSASSSVINDGNDDEKDTAPHPSAAPSPDEPSFGNPQENANEDNINHESTTVPHPSATPSPDKPSSPTPASPAEAVSIDCSVDGFFPHPNNCRLFYQCENGGTFPLDCGSLYFDESISACNWRHLVKCNKNN